MCTTVKSPTPKPVEEKDPIYMRNPWLDGLGIGAESRGRNSLRIDLGGAPARSPDLDPPGLTWRRRPGGPGSGGTRGFTDRGRGLTIGNSTP